MNPCIAPSVLSADLARLREQVEAAVYRQSVLRSLRRLTFVVGLLLIAAVSSCWVNMTLIGVATK